MFDPPVLRVWFNPFEADSLRGMLLVLLGKAVCFERFCWLICLPGGVYDILPELEDLVEAVLGDDVLGNCDSLLGGLIPFLPGEMEFRPGDCRGLLNGCC